MRIPVRSRFGDVVIDSDEDVVIANSPASNDMMQDAFQGAPRRRYLYSPVGGGPFPYFEQVDVGPLRFGEVAINSQEGVVVASSDQAFDMMQTEFADDMITSGDEGLGYAQAQRLKRKLGRNKRRLRANGTYAVVEGGAPYQFGAVSFSPIGALKGGVVGGLIGGFKPKIDLMSRAAHEAQRGSTYDIWYDEAVGGNRNSLELLRQAGGVPVAGMPGPPWPRIAPSQGSKDYAAGKYRQAVAQVGAGPLPS